MQSNMAIGPNFGGRVTVRVAKVKKYGKAENTQFLKTKKMVHTSPEKDVNLKRLVMDLMQQANQASIGNNGKNLRAKMSETLRRIGEIVDLKMPKVRNGLSIQKTSVQGFGESYSIMGKSFPENKKVFLVNVDLAEGASKLNKTA